MKSIVVFGAGRFGEAVSIQLSRLGNEVLLVDKNEDLINAISPFVTNAVCCNVEEESATSELGLSNFDIAIIAIGTNLEAAILATLACTKAGIENIYAKAKGVRNGEILKKLGANFIIYPEYDMGLKIADKIHSGKLLDFIQVSSEYSILQIKVPSDWVGSSLLDLNIRVKYGANIIAVKHDNNIDVSPDPNYIFKEDDIVLIIGEISQLNSIS